MRPGRAVRAYAQSCAGLRRWLSETMSFSEARGMVTRRLEGREEAFLQLVEGSVFGNPRSPYLPLLQQAGCTLADLAAGVRRDGIEAELVRLREAGVWISLDEFKGRTPLERGRARLCPTAEDFDNPEVLPVFASGSGGSSGRPVRSIIDLEHLTVRASYQAFFLNLMGVQSAPLLQWYPPLPAASGVVNALLHAKLGRPPTRWFSTGFGREGLTAWQGRVLTIGLIATSRSAPYSLPWLERGSLQDVLRCILRARDRAGRCAFQSYVSRSVRLSRAARDRGWSLEGVAFHLGAEPVTPARCAEIRVAGAEGWPRYASTEMGTIGVGCTDPAEVGDVHLCRDLVAALPSGPDAAGEAPVLHMTSLHPACPKVMLNVQLGDCARVVRRRCACPLGEMGLDVHLLGIHSVARVTCEGMTVGVADLTRIVEEVIIPHYGGSPVDYQWVETEDERGQARLHLCISPGVGRLDTRSVERELLDALGRLSPGSSIAAGAWREAGTVRVVRQAPRQTAAGKTLPFARAAGQ